MSLVYEALQKAEREKERKTGVAPVTPPKPPVTAAAPPPVTKPARAPHHYLAIVTVAGAVLLLVAAYYLVGATSSSRPVAAETPLPQKPAETPPPTPVEPPPATQTENDPRFKLTGIMGKPDGGFGAIINGRSVYEGNYIDGATVEKIERDRVTLNYNGRVLVLRLS